MRYGVTSISMSSLMALPYAHGWFHTPAAGCMHSYALFHTAIGPFLHPAIPPRLCMPSLVCTTCSLFAFTSACPPGHTPSTGFSSTPPGLPYLQTSPCASFVQTRGLRTKKRTHEAHFQAPWAFATSRCTSDELPRSQCPCLCACDGKDG